jgi:hypothetical protein
MGGESLPLAGYCVRRYPFERGRIPATPLNFHPYRRSISNGRALPISLLPQYLGASDVWNGCHPGNGRPPLSFQTSQARKSGLPTSIAPLTSLRE